jgi:hypothetical protein
MNTNILDDSAKYIEWWRTHRGRKCIVRTTDVPGNWKTYQANFLTPPEFMGVGIRVFCLGIREDGCSFSTAHRNYDIKFTED